ncbi:unnamed protein product, partial [Ectocarpus sp. 12 AP-2014]
WFTRVKRQRAVRAPGRVEHPAEKLHSASFRGTERAIDKLVSCRRTQHARTNQAAKAFCPEKKRENSLGDGDKPMRKPLQLADIGRLHVCVPSPLIYPSSSPTFGTRR